MGELANIVSLHRAIDDAVVRGGAEVAARVSGWLPAYGERSDDAARDPVGWFERFNELSDGTFAAGVPDVDQALAEMAEQPPSGRMRARRLLAIAALAAAEPERFGPGGEQSEIVHAALSPLVPEDGDVARDLRSASLLELLVATTDSIIAGNRREEWERMLQEAKSRQLLDDATAAQTTPPCNGYLIVEQVQGQTELVTVLTTEFTVPDTTLEELAPYFDPARWPDCVDLWCAMDLFQPPGDPKCYLEMISLDCDSGASWQLRTCLEFKTITQPDSIVLSYRLCTDPTHMAKGDGVVNVDRGTITARRRGTGVHIITTKRVHFDESFFGEALAAWACALGYASAAEDMVYSCARSDDPLTEDVGQTTHEQGAAMSNEHAEEPVDLKQLAAETTAAIDRMVANATASLEDCAAAVKKVVTKAAGDTYTADELAKDAAEMWVRSLRDALRLWSPGEMAGSQQKRPVPDTDEPPP